jgi:hypothetical protein
MHALTILVAIIFSIFSTSILSYISLATPIGPWIAPTLAAMVLVFTGSLGRLVHIRSKMAKEIVVYSTIAGSVGGILASALCWTLPTIYFICPQIWTTWVKSPGFFIAVTSMLVLCAGSLSMLLTHLWRERILYKGSLPFPVGQMVYRTTELGIGVHGMLQAAVGFVVTLTVLCAQRIRIFGSFLLPRAFCLVPPPFCYSVNFASCMLRIDVIPLLVSIGFVAGHLVAIPMLVGVISKIAIMQLIHDIWFMHLGVHDFGFAFCGGIVLSSVFTSLGPLLRMIHRGVKAYALNLKRNGCTLRFHATRVLFTKFSVVIALLVVGGIVLGFKLPVFIFVILGTVASANQLALISGKIGLAPLGRFATFVMLPAILLFKVTMIQAVVIAAFVELTGGIVCDMFAGQRVVQLAGLDMRTARRYQLLGLLVGSITIGCVLLILVNRFGLGSQVLFAQRAQARALLLNTGNFAWSVSALGLLFGFALKYVRINTMLVLGALLMPVDFSLMLVAGGMLSYLVADRRVYEPFWSGVFVSNSLWMVLKALV